MENSLQETYRYHHGTFRREGLAIFKDLRGEYLRARIGEGKRVLDIGCRDGALTLTYAKGNEVVAADIDSVALKALEGIMGIKTMQMDLNGTWELPAHSFDVVVAAEVLEHLYYPGRVLERITGVLKNDGMLIGSVPNAFSLKNRIRLLFGRKHNTPLADPTHINHFSRAELTALFKEYFQKVEIVPVGRYAFLENIFPGLFSFMMLFCVKNPKQI